MMFFIAYIAIAFASVDSGRIYFTRGQARKRAAAEAVADTSIKYRLRKSLRTTLDGTYSVEEFLTPFMDGLPDRPRRQRMRSQRLAPVPEVPLVDAYTRRLPAVHQAPVEYLVDMHLVDDKRMWNLVKSLYRSPASKYLAATSFLLFALNSRDMRRVMFRSAIVAALAYILSFKLGHHVRSH